MSSRSPGRRRTALILCGALSADANAWIEESGRDVDIHPLPPLLHNRPERIAPEVERLIGELRERYDEIVIGYADCGSYGAIDEMCERRRSSSSRGSRCSSSPI